MLSAGLLVSLADGAVAAAYIQRVRQLLEAPGLLFVDPRDGPASHRADEAGAPQPGLRPPLT